jgi:hypothetical protein
LLLLRIGIPQNHKSFASNHHGKKTFDKIMLHEIEQYFGLIIAYKEAMGLAFIQN